jgi:hypothetical protein
MEKITVSPYFARPATNLMSTVPCHLVPGTDRYIGVSIHVTLPSPKWAADLDVTRSHRGYWSIPTIESKILKRDQIGVARQGRCDQP